MSNKLKLYAHPESGHSYKVKLMLTLAGVDHDYMIVDILIDRDRRPEPFRSLSLARFGEVPLLVSGQDVFVQSNAILLHLASDLGVLGGSNPNLMARAREWLLWEANKLGLSLPHLRLARNYFPDDFSAGAVEWLQARYDADSLRLEREFDDGRPFILGVTYDRGLLSLWLSLLGKSGIGYGQAKNRSMAITNRNVARLEISLSIAGSIRDV